MNTREMFKNYWDAEVAKRLQQSPSYGRDEFVATGRAPAKYGGKRTEAWWLDNGPSMIDKWIEWRKTTRWQTWTTPTGLPAIETELNITLPGDIPVKMFIDWIAVTPAGQMVVCDWKTGRTPETPEQLGLYATGLELTWGPEARPDFGYFWTPDKLHSRPHYLAKYTPDYFASLYASAARGINAGAFLPHPANNCANWCGVARYCTAVDGPDAEGVDPLTLHQV